MNGSTDFPETLVHWTRVVVLPDRKGNRDYRLPSKTSEILYFSKGAHFVLKIAYITYKHIF